MRITKENFIEEGDTQRVDFFNGQRRVQKLPKVKEKKA